MAARIQSSTSMAQNDASQTHSYDPKYGKKFTFMNNTRALVLLIPCWFVLIAIIGRLYLYTVAVAVLLLSALASFVLDGLGFHFTAMQVPVVGLAVLNLGQLVAGSFLLHQSLWYLFLLCQNAIIILTTAMWIMLQFPWIGNLSGQFSVLPRACERGLFAGLPFPAAALLTWASLPVVGTDSAPFVFTAYLFFNYALCILPLSSSFSASPAKNAAKAASTDPNAVVLGKIETGINTIGLLLSPGLFYMLWHTYNLSALRWIETVAFFALPFVFLRVCCKTSNPYWWLGIQDPSNSTFVRASSLLGVSFVVSAAQVYIVSSPFVIVLPEPLNYIVLTLCFYSIVVLFEIFTGGVGSSIAPETDDSSIPSSYSSNQRRISYIAGCCAAVTSSMALGVPLMLYPAPVLGSLAAVSFYWKPRMSKYLFFTATLAAGMLWFMYHKVWFVDFDFLSWPLPIYGVCALVLVAFNISILIPGIVASQYFLLSGMTLLFHALLISFLEGLLYFEPGGLFYPWYFVVATSALGCVTVLKLQGDNRITRPARWIVCSVYVAKLAILLHPLDWAVPLALAVIAPFARVSIFWGTDRTEPMSQKEGIVYAGIALFMALISKNNLQPRLWESFGMTPESDGVLWGSSLLLASLTIIPISWKHLPQLKMFRLAAVLLASAGAGLVVIFQPSAVFSFQGRFGVVDYISSSPTATYGLGMFAVPLFLIATGTIDLAQSLLTKLLFIIFCGSGAGLVTTKFALPDHFGRTPIYIALTFITLFIFTVMLLVFSQSHGGVSDVSAVIINSYIAITGCGITLYFLEGTLAHLSPHELRNFRMVTLSALALINLSVATWLNLFAPKSGRIPGKMRQRIPLIANTAMAVAFILAFIVNVFFFRGTEASIFVIALILLLRRRSGDALASPLWFPSLIIVLVLYLYSSYRILVAPVLDSLASQSTQAGSIDLSFVWRGISEEGFAITSGSSLGGLSLLFQLVIAFFQIPALSSFLAFLRRPLTSTPTRPLVKFTYVLLGIAGFLASIVPAVRYICMFAMASVLLRSVAPEQIQ